MYVHARDPFLRVEALRSARRVEVELQGVGVLADSRRAVLVQETGLVNRWYIPLADVDTSRLRASDTATLCPYKGRAQYASVMLDGGRLLQDVAWAIREHLSFYVERPEVCVHCLPYAFYLRSLFATLRSTAGLTARNCLPSRCDRRATVANTSAHIGSSGLSHRRRRWPAPRGCSVPQRGPTAVRHARLCSTMTMSYS